MKKLVFTALIIAVALSVTACSESQSRTPEATTPSATTQATPEETTAPVATEAGEAITPETANEIARSLLANDALVERYLSKCQYLVDSDRAITFTEDGMDWVFAPVADSRCPFMSVDDIKIFLNDNYTRRFYENSVYVYIIGADGYSVNYIDYEGVLYQNITGGGGGSTEWAYETLTVSEITDTSFCAECGGMTLYDEAVTAKMTIVLDEGLWKIDSFKTE